MRRNTGSGMSLIDMMLALAILAIGVNLSIGSAQGHQRASRRAAEEHGIARLLDQELERLRACQTRGCIEVLATTTATTAFVDPKANTWVRALVRRQVSPGPDSTVLVEVSARPLSKREDRTVRALLWVSE